MAWQPPARLSGYQGVGPESFVRMERFKEGYELFGFGLGGAVIYVADL
jgi:hypothetical protein